MKHVVAQADMMVGMRNARALLSGGDMGALGRTKAPVWLPAPSIQRSRVSTPESASRPKPKIASSIWLRPEPERISEKVMMSGLVVAAVAGIAYGFNMLIDLLEHWAVFQTTVAQALQ